MQLSDYIINSSTPLLNAMEIMDSNGKGIVYVCDENKLKGSLTDGDIRRHILKNGNIKLPVFEIANHHPIYLNYQDQYKANEIMELHKIRSIPILNDDDEIIDIVFIRENKQSFRAQLEIPVVIMAGGKGTRLYPYTQILPKPLIPIGEKTITEHIMDRFEEFGCKHFDIIVNYKKNFIKSYFLDHEYPKDITFIEEDKYLGTGGGLKLLEGRYSSSFFMSNCDILIEEDYSAILNFHQEKKNLVTMICAVKNITIPYGTVDVSDSGQVISLNEKPQISFITNTGFYVLEPEFLHEIPQNTFIHITDVIQRCIDKGKRIGLYPIYEDHWLDMGQLDELEKMRQKLKS